MIQKEISPLLAVIVYKLLVLTGSGGTVSRPHQLTPAILCLEERTVWSLLPPSLEDNGLNSQITQYFLAVIMFNLYYIFILNSKF